MRPSYISSLLLLTPFVLCNLYDPPFFDTKTRSPVCIATTFTSIESNCRHIEWVPMLKCDKGKTRHLLGDEETTGKYNCSQTSQRKPIWQRYGDVGPLDVPARLTATSQTFEVHRDETERNDKEAGSGVYSTMVPFAPPKTAVVSEKWRLVGLGVLSCGILFAYKDLLEVARLSFEATGARGEQDSMARGRSEYEGENGME